MNGHAVPSPATSPWGSSETARLIRDHDWEETSLGPIADWPQTLRTALGIILPSPVAMTVLWGADGVMLYNDAYAIIAGARHPRLLGLPVNDGWPEVSELNDHILENVLAGGTLSYRDQEMRLFRDGKPEQMWANLDYSPLICDTGGCVGVMGIVTETTDRVLADRQRGDQHERLRAMFDQAPGFIAMMEGPEHTFVLINQAYTRLMGQRHVVGQTVRDAVPEAIDHGLLQALDTVYATGKPFIASDFKFAVPDASGAIEDHYLDFVYQPIRDEAGNICGVFAQGSDVTERVLAEEALRKSKQEYRRLNDALIKANNILASVPRAPLE